ncbi:hypothetical protein WA158_007444 [Blastocystis sp. Blastoise]
MSEIFSLKRITTLPTNKVECFKTYFNKESKDIYIYLGLKSGKVMLYQFKPEDKSPNPTNLTYKLYREDSIQISKKKISKIVLIPDFKRILLLANGELLSLDMFTLKPVYLSLQIDTIYDFYVDSISSVYSRVCFVNKKKIQIFNFDNQKMEFFIDFNIQSPPTTLLFTRDTIYMGSKDGYIVIDIISKSGHQFQGQLKSSSAPCISYMPNGSVLVNQNNDIL